MVNPRLHINCSHAVHHDDSVGIRTRDGGNKSVLECELVKHTARYECPYTVMPCRQVVSVASVVLNREVALSTVGRDKCESDIFSDGSLCGRAEVSVASG